MKVKINEVIDYSCFKDCEKKISDELLEILKGLLNTNAKNRLSVADALQME